MLSWLMNLGFAGGGEVPAEPAEPKRIVTRFGLIELVRRYLDEETATYDENIKV